MMMVEGKWQGYVFPDWPILAIPPTQSNCPNRYHNRNRVKLKASDSHCQRTATQTRLPHDPRHHIKRHVPVFRRPFVESSVLTKMYFSLSSRKNLTNSSDFWRWTMFAKLHSILELPVHHRHRTNLYFNTMFYL
jgi:hypothetical protein